MIPTILQYNCDYI